MSSAKAPTSIFSYESLVHAIAGACGSSVAVGVTLPLDTARVRMLLDERMKSKGAVTVLLEIAADEGLAKLYRGAKSTLQAVAISQFIYFYAFHGMKRAFVEDQSAGKDLLLACVAGAVNVLITNPLWVVNTRLKLQGVESGDGEGRPRFRGLLDGLIKICRREGLVSLWNGTLPSLVLVSNPAIKFTVYEFLKRKVLAWNPHLETLDPGRIFFMGVVASAVATVLTYPIQVIQTKTRHGHDFSALRRDASTWEVARYIVRNFGPGYLFKGLEAKMLQSLIASGCTFLTYEKIATLVFYVFRLQKAKLT